jgi:hypothetical protein
MAVDESELDIRELRTDIKWIRQKLEGNCEENKKMRERVSALENWRSGTVAALTLLAALIGWGWLQPGG